MPGELTTNTGSETGQLRFQRFLSLGSFAALKAILDKIAPNPEALWEAARTAGSYEELLGRLGYKLLLIKQIHVQDAYSRLGPAGGIKAVLPYHDVATYSSFPTLINFDSTLTNTAKGAAFFNELFTELKRQLKVQP